MTSRVAARVAVLAVALLGGGGAWWLVHSQHGGAPAEHRAVVAHGPPQGAIETPRDEPMVASKATISGWVTHPSGIARVEIRIDGHVVDAQLTPERGGSEGDPAARVRFAGSAALDANVSSSDRRPAEVVAIARNGERIVLGSRTLINPEFAERWRAYARGAPFHLLPALSGLELGRAAGLDSAYRAYETPGMRIGTRIPILYLRTTKGDRADWTFDPDWDVRRRCMAGTTERPISDDSLNGAFRYATEHALPLLFTLNGGIWADAACDIPAWDVNDALEQDPANCQWNERNEVVADDYLKKLAGAFDSPELARSLTFNVYAGRVRHYKRRNLQQAGAAIVAFARAHPDLFVGVTLEPDLYLNPFFEEKAWFDYNPGTLRQFREWLAGSGPYAGHPAPGVPDLRRYRRAHPLSLADVRRIAGKPFRSWAEVDPPRTFLRADARPFWRDPWVYEWEVFRRHLVHLHYDELAEWLVEAGIPRDRIWSSQGFMAPHASAMPFALRIDSPVKNYDSGGMSIEGAKPREGHLGAILYGPSAQNSIRMEGSHTLFGAFAALDPAWAVTEYNSADLRQSAVPPTYADAYRGLRDMWNYGARFVSPMAWAGSDGANVGQPGYDPFTAWRHTPLEDAAKDFLLAHANLPPGSRLWTFGASAHADPDGWALERGTVRIEPGRLRVNADAGSAVLLSPKELMLKGKQAMIVLDFDREPGQGRLAVQALDGRQWTATFRSGTRQETAIDPGRAGVDQVRLKLELPGSGEIGVLRVAIIPLPTGKAR